jgi:hypothetical protein
MASPCQMRKPLRDRVVGAQASTGDHAGGFRPRHVGHWLEWVRTIVPCFTLVIQVVTLVILLTR